MAKEKKEKNVKKENKSFMKNFKAELKRVVWPTSKQMVNNVTAVIVIVLITAAIVFCLDFVFEAMNKYGIDKLKTNIQSKNQEQVQTIENVDAGNNEQNNNSEENKEDGSSEVVNNEEANNNENEQNNNSEENKAE